MAYDESFAQEPETTTAALPETIPATPEIAAQPIANQQDIAEPIDAEADQQQGGSTEEEEEEESSAESVAQDLAEVPTQPAFNEAEYLKAQFGENAPATASELKLQLDALQAKQITPAQEAQLAMLRDPARLSEFAKMATQDFDKLDAVEVMRQSFAAKYPDMGTVARERRFLRQFTETYPTLADALINPDDYAADDPALIADREDADFDAGAQRTALKAAHLAQTQQFMDSQTAAASQPQLTAEQQADVNSLPVWLDQSFKDGTTIPVKAGDGLTLNLPIANAASFKAAFNDTYGLLDKLTLTKPLSEGGVLNRENHALVTAMLQDPQAFVQNIAKQVRAGLPVADASIPLSALTNSSAAKQGAGKSAEKSAVKPAKLNQPAYVDADAWQNSNV